MSGWRSRATIVVTILVMLAGASRANGSTLSSTAPEASSTTATCGAVTLGGGSLPTCCGPPVLGNACEGVSGGVMRITGTSGGNATWAGGAAVSQYCCCASRVGSGVATAVGVAGSVGTTVGRGVEGTVGTGVGGGVGAKVGTGVGA